MGALGQSVTRLRAMVDFCVMSSHAEPPEELAEGAKGSGVRITVCIPTIRETALEYAVRSIRRQTLQDWELVVVGQGDEAPLREATERAADGDARVRYLHLNRWGASAARNAALAAGTGEIVAFMDDDCEAREDWLATLSACFTPEIGFVCGTVEAPPKEPRLFAICPRITPEDVVYDPAQTRDVRPPGFGLLGANMAVRRSVAERVGIFDECLGPGSQFAGGEEHDYADRLAQLGVKMRSTPAAVVRHSYGYRYGIRAVYGNKSSRLRGDGGLAAKRTLLRTRAGELSVRTSMIAEARRQLTTIRLTRLANNSFRLFHYLASYRECLVGYEISQAAGSGPATAVLTPLAAKPVSHQDLLGDRPLKTPQSAT
jgi:glycosyltransferase involved in cell wall biosynthesis